MTFTYNGVTYIVTDESIYRDFTILAGSLEEACDIVNALDGMTDYTFSAVDYADMIVYKRTITISDVIAVNVKLRRKTQMEQMKEELNGLKTAMADLALTTNKTTTDKINKILDEGVR
jgi:hypothetical protein